jgi:hypothetical protein
MLRIGFVIAVLQPIPSFAHHGRGLLDASGVEGQPNALHRRRVELARDVERDRPFRGVLDGSEEELAARHVRVTVVDRARSTAKREPKIRLRADDPHLVGGVEPREQAVHGLRLLVPVAQAGGVEEVLERPQLHAGLLGQRVRRELAADPRDLVGHRSPEEGSHGPLGQRAPLRAEFRRPACVVGRLDGDPRVHVVGREQVDRRDLARELLRRLRRPYVVVRPQREVHPEEGIGALRGDQPHHLLDQRPGGRLRANHHLPAGLYAEAALDEEPRVLGDAWVYSRH